NLAVELMLFNTRQHDQSNQQVERPLELHTNFYQAYWGLGAAHLYMPRHQPAIAAMQRAVQLARATPLFLATLGEAYAAGGYRQEAQKILEQLQVVAKERYVSPYGVAHIRAALVSKEEALHWLGGGYRG